MPNRAAGLDWDADGERAPGRRGGRRSGPATRLTTQAIVDAAIRIADADGLDAVTIRRVAAALGARPMSLYTHIAAKADLLALMTNEFMSLIVVDEPQPTDWREAVSDIARHMHAAFVAHPWAFTAFTRRPRLGPNAARQGEQMARAVASLKLDQADVWTVLGTVNDYVIGNALRIFTVETAPDIADAMSVIDVSEFPEIKVLPASVERHASSERFDSGLQIVLDGIERRFPTGSPRRRGGGHRKGSDASSEAG